MIIRLGNRTDKMIICETQKTTLSIEPNQMISINIERGESLFVRHCESSYTLKKWFGLEKYIKADLQIDYEDIYISNCNEINVYEITKKSTEYIYVFYEIFHLDNCLINTKHCLQGKKEIEKSVLKREKIQFVLLLFAMPFVYFIADRTILNYLFVKLIKASIGSTLYFAISVFLYVLVFTINGLFQTVEYIHTCKEIKNELESIFCNNDMK